MMSFFKARLSRRLFLLLALVTMVPVSIMGYAATLATDRALTQFAFLHMQTIAGDHANHLNTWLRERSEDIKTLAQLPTVRSYCEDYCDAVALPGPEAMGVLDQFLALIQENSIAYKNIHIIAQNGNVLASTDRSSEHLRNVNQLEEFTLLKEKSEIVFGTVHSHPDHSLLMHLLSPVLGPNGRTVAYVLALIDVRTALEPLMSDRVGLGQTGEAYLVDAHGERVTPPWRHSSSQNALPVVSSFVTEAALKHAGGTAIYKNHKGQKVVGSYLWLPEFSLELLAEMNKEEILAPLATLRMVAVATATVVILLCLVPAFIVTQRVSRPIIQVAEAAKAISEGNLNQSISFSSPDEIGILAASFNSMALQLRQLIGSLRSKETTLRSAYDHLIVVQERLVQSERMAAIGEFVSAIVHEMRNPLSSVKLNVQMMGRSFDENSPLRENYHIAKDQVFQLERMFSELLEYGKPPVLEKSAVAMDGLVDKALRQLQSEPYGHNLRVVREWPAHLPYIWGDAEKIEQILANLLRNAVEAGASEVSVRIQIDNQALGQGEFLSLTITDNGMGISRQNLKRIFQPFFTTKKRGTGLGLANVKKMVDAHGGSIFILSEWGKGAAVHVRFPCG